MGHLVVDNGYQAKELIRAPCVMSTEAMSRKALRRPDSICPMDIEPPQKAPTRVPMDTDMISCEVAAAKCSQTVDPGLRRRAATDSDRQALWQDEEFASTPSCEHFVAGLGLVLTRWAEATAAAPKPRNKTHFDSAHAPPMGISDYLTKRIHRYFLCSESCYVLALVYMDRLGKVDPAMAVCDLNVHRMLATALLVAAKFNDDVYFANGYYAKVSGLSLREINLLESRFLKLLSWQVRVTPEEYRLYHGLVCQAICPPGEYLGNGACAQEPEPEPWHNA